MNEEGVVPERNCFECGVPLCECMGSIVAGDFLDFLEGKILFSQVRERCGHCVLRCQIKSGDYNTLLVNAG